MYDICFPEISACRQCTRERDDLQEELEATISAYQDMISNMHRQQTVITEETEVETGKIYIATSVISPAALQSEQRRSSTSKVRHLTIVDHIWRSPLAGLAPKNVIRALIRNPK